MKKFGIVLVLMLLLILIFMMSSLSGNLGINSLNKSFKGNRKAEKVQYDDHIVKISKAFHKNGQTFIIFDELLKIDWKTEPTYKELFKEHEELSNKYKVSYNIYKSNRPIKDVYQLKPIRTIDSFSGWNTEIQGINTNEKSDKALRYVCNEEDGPLKPYQGVAVITATEKQDVYYAVTATFNGREYKRIEPDINSTSIISEEPGEPKPVLQLKVSDIEFYGQKNSDAYYYTRWESKDNSAIEGRPFDYLVVKTKKESKEAALGLHLHGWDGSLTSGFGPWTRQGDNSIFVSSNQYPYDWWTGYQQKHYSFDKPLEERTAEDYKNTVVRPYTSERLLSFVDWMDRSDDWQFDIDKLYVAGSSMGGSGSSMLGIRYPNRIAWCRSATGVHNPNNIKLKWSYESVYGKPDFNPKFEDGTAVWDYYNDIWYLKQNIEKGIGLIVYSNGKNDEVIDWQQAVDFTNTLQETRQAHIFTWGQDGHRQSAKLPVNQSIDNMLLNLKAKQSLPAFTNCSLDDDYGDGDPLVGAYFGQVNAFLMWEPDTIIDNRDNWQVTINLIEQAPEENCTVDITARKLQEFILVPGEQLTYTIEREEDKEIIQSGEVIVDDYGLCTINDVTISKEKYRLIIKR